MVEYDDGKEKQCNFKHEEDVDRWLAYVEVNFPQIPLHSEVAEQKLAEKAKRMEESSVSEIFQKLQRKISAVSIMQSNIFIRIQICI